MISSTPLTISYGDAAGEANSALDTALDVMRECGASLELEIIAMGADFYRLEIADGILPESFESIARTKLLLKSATALPKTGMNDVTKVICERYGINSSVQYFVSEKTGGVGIVADAEDKKIEPQNIADIYALAQKLGGTKFAYSVDDLALMLENEGENYPKISAKFYEDAYLKDNFADFDVIFSAQKACEKLKKEIKPIAGCTIYFGNEYAIFEEIEGFKDAKSLLLAAALMLKFTGQADAAWAVYEGIIPKTIQ